MRLIEKAFEIAKKEDGVKEIPGPKSNPRVLEYHKATDLKATDDDVAWCSAFANWCIQKAGGAGTKNAMARSWLKWGKEVKQPKEGEIVIVIYERGNNGYSGHVGFTIYKKEGTYHRTFGGNQNNMVCWGNFERSKVLGYRTSKD